MIKFKSNLKVRISTEYSCEEKNHNNDFSSAYSASVKQNVINRKMRVPGSKYPSRFISENTEKR